MNSIDRTWPGRVGTSMKRSLVVVVTSLALMFGLATPVFAASAYHTYSPSNCQIKISGFEHWGKAAASTRDNNAACWKIRAQVKYNNSSGGTGTLTGGVETDSYTKTVAGSGTDWYRANGRSENLSYTWWGLTR